MLKVIETQNKTVVKYELKVSNDLYQTVEFNMQKRKLKDLHRELTTLCKQKNIKVERAKHGSIAQHLKQLDTYIQQIHNSMLNSWLNDLNGLTYLNNDTITIEQYKQTQEFLSKYPTFGNGSYSVYSYIEKLYNTYDELIERAKNTNTLTKISLTYVNYEKLQDLINKYY